MVSNVITVIINVAVMVVVVVVVEIINQELRNCLKKFWDPVHIIDLEEGSFLVHFVVYWNLMDMSEMLVFAFNLTNLSPISTLKDPKVILDSRWNYSQTLGN